MSAVDELERRYDGPIPRAQLLAALRADIARIEATARRSHEGKPGRIVVKAAIAVPVMAELMATRLASDGACTEEDLKRAGCNAATIARHLDAARALAARIAAERGLQP